MNVDAQLAIDRCDWRTPEKPIGESDSMATKIHQRATTRAIHIQKPITVWTEMFFALFDEMDFSERPGVGHFFRLQKFGREEKFLSIHQEHTMLFRGTDHLLTFGNGQGQRLFADNVLSSRRAVLCHLRMQTVRCRNGHHLDVFLVNHLAVVGKDSWDIEFPGERCCIARSGRGYSDYLSCLWHDLQ